MFVLRSCHLAVAAVFAAILVSPAAFGYSFYKYGAGLADYLDHYDFPSVMWPAQLGNLTYDFGNIGGFSSLPTGLNATSVETAARNAGPSGRTGPTSALATHLLRRVAETSDSLTMPVARPVHSPVVTGLTGTITPKSSSDKRQGLR